MGLSLQSALKAHSMDILCATIPQTKQIKYNSNEKMSLCLNLLIVAFCMYKKAMQV